MPIPTPPVSPPPGFIARAWRAVRGRPRDIRDPSTYHQISLVALLAWVGLGADGLSSSSYGPEEAFKALGEHHSLAVGLALATALTVFIISYSYSRIIEHFPFGGGGYIVASKLLGRNVGVISGSALLIDYVLTITTSVAAGAEALFSFLPAGWGRAKLPVEFAALGLLLVLNLRGVKESVAALAPIFVLFVGTHAVLIIGILAVHLPEAGEVARETAAGFGEGLATLGGVGMAALFLRAYSMGAGTYTGIEAVSNGLQIMREPKVETAKRTMVYMALSLAVTAAGITLGYLLVHAHPEPGKTMNAVLAEGLAGGWGAFGRWFVAATLLSEAALLFVAAQTGFIDGPRVMANMANDSWLPHRFGQLSDRLVAQDGVVLITGAAAATLLYTRGDVGALVLMYSINVFLTFSLSQLAMIRFWVRRRGPRRRLRPLGIHLLGFVLCASILVVSVAEKFGAGGWVTLAVTSLLVGLCFLIRRHYRGVQASLSRLDEILSALPTTAGKPRREVDPKQPTAALLVGGYGGLGIHALLAVHRVFRGHFKNFVFLSVGVVDSAAMKGVEEVDRVREQSLQAVESYVALAQRLGLAATSRVAVGTEAVAEAEKLCAETAREFPAAVFFAGKLVFQRESWFQRLLHNETALQLQRRLQFAGLNTMVLPVRILDGPGP